MSRRNVRNCGQVKGQVIGLLQQTLNTSGCSRRLSTDLLLRVIVGIGLLKATITAVSQRVALGVSDETLRKAIYAALPPMWMFPELFDKQLQGWIKKAQRRKRGVIIAIDLHHQPYYGKPQKGLFRGKAKQGTKKFWSIATACVVERGEKLTLAMAPVYNNRMEDTLDALWPQLQSKGIRIRRLLLDRGFYSADVIDWLQSRNVPFLMPMICRGKKPSKNSPGTGTAQFMAPGRRGFTTHTWKKRRSKLQVTVQVAIVPNPKTKQKTPLLYAYHGRLPNLTYCRELYRKRFGIETSYRESRHCRAWTTTRKENWRRFLQILSFILANAWALLTLGQQKKPWRERLTQQHFQQQLIELLDLPTTQVLTQEPSVAIT
ncbi:hypothetical protein Mal4_59020 [Maioricimonas rarisocia]|uniref:Transposase IS4-like domain-containing protein n=1 Tax=Maioricimonas rarisocia TaxID=2528026 RepID=A0A517ZGE2_9PLAN|nr:transposase [Maioricimonas rarisocia]QDU41534.1 hypothetical protein Mal4_59020 [Maioricimonas rarisocia]